MLASAAWLLLIGAHAPTAAQPVTNRAAASKIEKILHPTPDIFPDRSKEAAEAIALDKAREAAQAAQKVQEALQAQEEQLARAREVQPVQVLSTPAETTPSFRGSHADWMAAAGIDPGNYGYVDFIVSHESGWNPNAVNRNGGACGLGQQLPCGKWPGAWNDPIAALRAMNVYVNNYGGWAGAYNFWRSHSWY